jgi:hypothetical protein
MSKSAIVLISDSMGNAIIKEIDCINNFHHEAFIDPYEPHFIYSLGTYSDFIQFIRLIPFRLRRISTEKFK